MNRYLKTSVIVTLILLFSTIIQFNSCAQPKVLKAGAAKSSITPTKGMDELKGRNLHDELYVKTIVLDDGTNRIAFLIADNQGIPTWITEIAKTKIQESTGIPASNIIISATHTHSGIVTAASPANLNNNPPTEYQNLLINKMVESTINAVDNLQPAKIGWGSIKKPEYVFNRRWYVQNQAVNPFGIKDSVLMNPGSSRRKDLIKPAGPTDPELYFIALKSASDEPIAILANYSLHYVGGVGKNDISADYYGAFEKELNKLLGTENNETKFIGIMSNGTSGDVNNNNYKATPEKLKPYEKINRVASDIASDVVKEINNIDFKDWLPIKAQTKVLDLKIRKSPSKSIKNNITKIAASAQTKTMFHSQEKYYATRVKNLSSKYPDHILAPITTFSIGELGISAIPFEVFAETGLELKKKSPFKDYFTIGLANGHWGYLPTPNQYKKGGYETWLTVGRAEEKASEKIVNNVLNQLKELKRNN